MAAEIYERDGVKYEIKVEVRAGQFLGKWHCPICQTSGGPKRWFHFEKEAIDRNRVSAFIEHHAVFHKIQRMAAG